MPFWKTFFHSLLIHDFDLFFFQGERIGTEEGKHQEPEREVLIVLSEDKYIHILILLESQILAHNTEKNVFRLSALLSPECICVRRHFEVKMFTAMLTA